VPGYEVETVTHHVGGSDFRIRSLLNRQQFSDPDGSAEQAGVSPSSWPLFGVVWPAGLALAEEMSRFPIAGKTILELGCGIALTSLVLARRGADITACDHHPLAEAFLQHNLALNDLPVLPFRTAPWLGPNPLLGRYDLIIGSDILYERDEAGTLAAFIDAYAAPACEVWVVDPNRGNRAHFHRHMAAQGFGMHEGFLDSLCTPLEAAYRGRMLTYVR